MSKGFQVTAILAAYNEGDIIAQVLEHLAREGVAVYLIDHESTDDTVAQAEPFLGRGLLAIERFPDEGPIPRAEATSRPWHSILRRKEQLARELEADWILHHDADEIRQSPWAGLSLAEALRRVDEHGYNAVDFEVFNFHPTGARFERGADLLEAFPFFDRAAPYDRVQIKAWKKTDAPLELVSSGGHEVVFPGRRVCPVRFILRHYPFRGQAHGRRKVFEERRPRLVAAERDREGWHRQYDEIGPDHQFVRDPGSLVRYDATAVRVDLALRPRGGEPSDEEVVSCRRTLDLVSRDLDQKNKEAERLHRDLDARNREVERLRRDLDERNREAEQLHRDLDARNREAERLHRDLDARNREAEGLHRDLDLRRRESEELRRESEELRHESEELRRESEELRRRLEDVLASRSWRWTKPLRTWLGRAGRHRP